MKRPIDTGAGDWLEYEGENFFVVRMGRYCPDRRTLYGTLKGSPQTHFQMAEMIRPKVLDTKYKGSFEAWYEAVKAKDYEKSERMKEQAQELWDEAESLVALYE